MILMVAPGIAAASDSDGGSGVKASRSPFVEASPSPLMS
jgi:hypothetical protein